MYLDVSLLLKTEQSHTSIRIFLKLGTAGKEGRAKHKLLLRDPTQLPTLLDRPSAFFFSLCSMWNLYICQEKNGWFLKSDHSTSWFPLGKWLREPTNPTFRTFKPYIFPWVRKFYFEAQKSWIDFLCICFVSCLPWGNKSRISSCLTWGRVESRVGISQWMGWDGRVPVSENTKGKPHFLGGKRQKKFQL